MNRWGRRLAAGLATLAVTAMPVAAQADAAVDRRVATAARAAMARTGAKGLAVAVVERGRVVSVQSFGARNAKGDALSRQTVMYGASLTKTVFAWLVMQLVDEGRIDLDVPVARYLPKPLPDYGNLDAYGNWGDLAGDDRWRAITARHLLTHSAGFANFAFLEPDGRLRFHFAPGARYAYSGEGIMLLQFVLEAGVGLKVGDELDRRLFVPLGMTKTSLTWRDDFAADLADGWTAEGKVEPHDDRSRVRAAGSMDTTIADMATFAAALVRGWGLSKAARAELARVSLPITTRAQFPTLLPEAPAAERIQGLGAGLGVVAFRGPQGAGFYKGGHNDSTGNTMVCVERGQRCVVILANDVRAEAAFPMIVRAAIGETGAPWAWEYPGLTPVQR